MNKLIQRSIDVCSEAIDIISNQKSNKDKREKVKYLLYHSINLLESKDIYNGFMHIHIADAEMKSLKIKYSPVSELFEDLLRCILRLDSESFDGFVFKVPYPSKDFFRNFIEEVILGGISKER